MAQTHAHLYASVGVHPDYPDVGEPSIDDLVTLAQHEKIVAIGETGLDYYRLSGDLEWPAHLSVRVVPEKRTSQTIAVPFDAVFWDEENHPHVWAVKEGGTVTSQAVKTGRTFGDAVEILEGLALGDTYISEASENITEGMQIEDAAVTEEPTAPEGDGHGHAHDE